jgi:hypothetical protein
MEQPSLGCPFSLTSTLWICWRNFRKLHCGRDYVGIIFGRATERTASIWDRRLERLNRTTRRVKHRFHPKCGSVLNRVFTGGFVQRPIWAITAPRTVALFATSVLPGHISCQGNSLSGASTIRFECEILRRPQSIGGPGSA